MRRYIEIANIIRERIVNNVYATGEKIPYGHQLCEEFSCSKITLNNALEILVNEGFITRQRGLGTVYPRGEQLGLSDPWRQHH